MQDGTEITPSLNKVSRVGKSFALDGLIGFILLLVGFMPAFLLQHLLSNSGSLIAAIGTVYFFAAFLRSRSPGNPLLQGLGIALGAAVPVLLLTSLMFRLMLPMMLTLNLLLVLTCICGAFASSFWRLKQQGAAAAVAFCIMAFGFATWHYAVPKIIAAMVYNHMNKPAPQFTLTRLDGTLVTPASLKGHVVVLDFWATWCLPCQAEMPALLSVYKQHANNPDVVYIAVDTGWEGDSDDKVRAFVTKKHFPFPVAFDTKNASNGFGISTIPTQVLLDREGHIRQVMTGNPDNDAELKDRLTSGIETLLKQ